MNQKDTHEFLTSHNFAPSKKMGQNFLINQEICVRIINNLNLENNDLLIEVGPGLASLTDELVKLNKKIVLIELDKRLCDFLKKRFKNYENITIINDDVLRVNFDLITKNFKNPAIVSNLPYSISSQVLINFIRQKNITALHCMLQKEMAQRIIEKERTKDYNALTVLNNFYNSVKKVLDIGPKNFMPEPNVGSVFVSIIKNDKPYDDEFNRFLRLCFLNKRKQLVNNLKNNFASDKIKNYLIQNNLPLTTRAEELNPEKLYNLYINIK